MSNKNNFTKEENRQNAECRMVIYYRDQFVNEKLPKQKYYNGYSKPNDIDYGKRRLIKMLWDRREKVETAVLYDVKTKKEIQKFDCRKY